MIQVKNEMQKIERKPCPSKPVSGPGRPECNRMSRKLSAQEIPGTDRGYRQKKQ
jgi:hypothetical protein